MNVKKITEETLYYHFQTHQNFIFKLKIYECHFNHSLKTYLIIKF